MRFPLSFALALALAPAALAQPKALPPNLVAPTDALSPADERKAFTVPAGFDVQLVACEPDVQKPMQMAFDAKGRLWVTTSYHYPFAAEKGKATDKLFVLSDFDPKTGKAGKVQTFASDLNIPIGVLPLPDCQSCIVSSVGEIRKYTDTDGDGKADKSEVLFSGFGVKDTHGMTNSFTLMPDGWVYACHGFNNDSTVKGKDGHEVKMHSGHTFRFKPDGSRIEVWTRGQVNPFGIAVDPWFNLYTADCHSKPITQLVPGAYYESFGKPHDGLGFTPHITRHDHGSTGLCGLSWYDADQFPKEYKGTLFLGNVVTNRINLDTIEWKGSTPVAIEQPDFLSSTDRWFRPVDIKLGPDGALYVADFYNKIIGHYEVDLKHPGRDKERGRIWRIVWTGKDGKAPAPKFAYTDLTNEDVREVYQLLDSPNMTVRLLATNQLIHRSEEMSRALKTGIKTREPFSERGLAHASWRGNSQSIDTSGITGALTTLKEHHTPLGVAHELRMAGAATKWDGELRAAVVGCFKDGPIVQRAAVEAAIAHPHADFVAPLVAVLKTCPADDALLRQAARIALRNCFLAEPAAFTRLQGIDEKTDVIFADVLLGARGTGAADLVVQIAKARDLPAATMPGVAEFVGRYAALDARTRFANTLPLIGEKTNRNAELLGFMLRGVQAQGAKIGPDEAKQLADAVGRVLENFASESEVRKDEPLPPVSQLRSVLPIITALPAVTDETSLPKAQREALATRLRGVVVHKRVPVELRAAYADAQFLTSAQIAFFTFRILIHEKDTPPALRERLLIAAAGSSSGDARLAAAEALKDVPYRVAVPVGLGFAGTSAGADILLTAVKEGKAPARLLQEKAILERLKASNVEGWEKQVAALTKNLPPADQRLANLIKTRTTGFAAAKVDKAEGAKLFTKHCAACHKIGDAGGKIAPQLDGIGLRGLERLLEDVLDPNRNVDAAFRARSISTTDDRTVTALMLRVDGEVLVVADLEGKEKRIPLKEITTNRETMLSAMPANFGDVVPEADFYQIVAYLLDQKAKPK